MSSRLSDYDLPLPDALIATHPSAVRDECRLMAVDRASGALQHAIFRDIPNLLRSGDVLVLNDSRVIRSRIHAVKKSGGRAEILLFKRIDERTWDALVRGKNIRHGTELFLPGDMRATIAGSDGTARRLVFSRDLTRDYLAANGAIPLPPYIIKRREADGEPDTTERDNIDYQNVYAQAEGSAAAPTAGLHFTDALLDAIAARGVEILRLTLHTGYGTFAPMSEDDITAHRMHAEEFIIPQVSAERIVRAKQEGRRIIATGTTAARVLESEYDADAMRFRRLTGETSIFIYPPYRPVCIDALITNFHTPRSTLLALVAAFAGFQHCMNAYRTARDMRYRFFSYGDAMFIH
ncbi:MAG: tRNA preQ1(34) S-adenosylmethionine ribosyltransferase-isomerase QueA [Spirochaetota bacterium]